MSKHIGIVACSAEGAALCYQTICNEAQLSMGKHRHPEVSMHTYPLAEYMSFIRAGNWDEVARLMLASADKLVRTGADFAICPDNTIHEAMDRVLERSPIPWLHIADVVAREALAAGARKLGITGTKYLMTGPVYPVTLEQYGISWEIPEEPARERIDNIIFDELVNGIFPEKSRLYFNEVATALKQKGCDALVLGCTEIPLLVDPESCPLPVLDSTRLLARAAIANAVNGNASPAPHGYS